MLPRYDVKDLKTFFIGAPKTGKSKLRDYLFFKKVNVNDYQQTVGIDFVDSNRCVTSLIFGNIHWNIKIWDMGVDDYQSFYSSKYNEMTCVCFIIDASQDFQMQKDYINKMLPPAKKDLQSFFVITKRDLVTAEQLSDLEHKILSFTRELANKDFPVESIIATSVRSDSYDADVGEFHQELLMQHYNKLGPDITYIPADKYRSISDDQRKAKHKLESETLAKFFPSYQSVSLDPDDDLYYENCHREKAVGIFHRLLIQSKNDPDRIATLLEVAKPQINRHQYPRLDKLFRKENTDTWSYILKQARETALETISAQTAKKEVSETELKAWRQHSLFAEHRNNSFLLGAFGNTKTQVKIDHLINQLKM